MHIANPIYDSVFKYLLEDNESAILLLSGLLGEEIEKLQLLPQEGTSEIRLKHRSLTVYRMDFSATIRTPTGSRQILIEIQKAKFASDIMRFRRYLGEQYKESTAKSEQGHPLPLHTIYFLGYKLDHVKNPVIKVNRHYYDGSTGQRIDDEKEDFIETLTHDSIIIQIPYLNEQGKSDLDRLLRIFDQHQHLGHDLHILNISDRQYPQKYQRLIRRLQRAMADDELRQTMDIEDDILLELGDKEREAARALEGEKAALEDKDRAVEEKDQALEDKDRAVEEKDQAVEEKDRAVEEKDQAVDEKSQALEEKGRALEEKEQALEEKKQALIREQQAQKVAEEKEQIILQLKKQLQAKGS